VARSFLLALPSNLPDDKIILDKLAAAKVTPAMGAVPPLQRANSSYSVGLVLTPTRLLLLCCDAQHGKPEISRKQ
jgi:hypothetical protein